MFGGRLNLTRARGKFLRPDQEERGEDEKSPDRPERASSHQQRTMGHQFLTPFQLSV